MAVSFLLWRGFGLVEFLNIFDDFGGDFCLLTFFFEEGLLLYDLLFKAFFTLNLDLITSLSLLLDLLLLNNLGFFGLLD